MNISYSKHQGRLRRLSVKVCVSVRFTSQFTSPLQVCGEDHRRGGALLPCGYNQALCEPPDSTHPHLQHQQLQPTGAGSPQSTAAVLVRLVTGKQGEVECPDKENETAYNVRSNRVVHLDALLIRSVGSVQYRSDSVVSSPLHEFNPQLLELDLEILQLSTGLALKSEQIPHMFHWPCFSNKCEWAEQLASHVFWYKS